MADILMPPGGQTTSGSVIVKWHKNQGDIIKRGDILFSIETDKAVLDVESFAAGVLTKKLFNEGDTAETGAVVAVVENIVLANPAVTAPAQKAQTAHVATPRVETPKAAEPLQERTPSEISGKSVVLASPLAKSIAREKNINISLVPSESGIIKKADVLRFINTAEKNTIADKLPAVSGSQSFILIDVNITALEQLLQQYSAVYGKAAPGYDKYINKAAVAAQKEFPLIRNFSVADTKVASGGTLTVSAAFHNDGADIHYVLAFAEKIKLLFENILLMLAI